jgi:hypothetical protein
MLATAQAAAPAHSSVVIGSACHTATVEQHPCFCNKRGDVPGLAGGAIPPASPPRFPSPMADRLGGAERELEQDMKPATPTMMRSHSVVKDGSESEDSAGSRAKMEPTVRRAEQAPGSPEECGARAQKDFSTGGGARFAGSRPPDGDDGSPGGRAVSAQSPTGTVMGL